jgi:hypothetical protein
VPQHLGVWVFRTIRSDRRTAFERGRMSQVAHGPFPILDETHLLASESRCACDPLSILVIESVSRTVGSKLPEWASLGGLVAPSPLDQHNLRPLSCPLYLCCVCVVRCLKCASSLCAMQRAYIPPICCSVSTNPIGHSPPQELTLSPVVLLLRRRGRQRITSKPDVFLSRFGRVK